MKTAVARKKFPRRAFTLIEIMIVVAIIGLIAAMGVPAILQTFRKEGMRKAVSDVMDLCSDARARAILQRTTHRSCFLSGGKAAGNSRRAAGRITDAAAGAPMNNSGTTPPPSPSNTRVGGAAGQRGHRDARHQYARLWRVGRGARAFFPERHVRGTDAGAAFRRRMGKNHAGIFHRPGLGRPGDTDENGIENRQAARAQTTGVFAAGGDDRHRHFFHGRLCDFGTGVQFARKRTPAAASVRGRQPGRRLFVADQHIGRRRL